MPQDGGAAQDQDAQTIDWFLWNGDQTNTLQSNSADGSLCIASPVSFAVLEQWGRYAIYCFTLTRQIDWRDVFAFIDQAVGVSECSSPLTKCPTQRMENICDFSDNSAFSNSALRLPLGAAFMKAVRNDCQRRFGAVALRFHQQRLFRWTRALARAIAHRLTDVTENGKSMLTNELVGYRVMFANRAARFTGAFSFLHSMLALLEIAESREMTFFEESDSAVLSKGHTQWSAPEKLPLLRTLTTPLSPVLFEGDCRATRCLSALLSESLNALWTDILHISWKHVNPKIMPDVVLEHLNALFCSQSQVHLSSVEERHLIFSETLRPLMVGSEFIITIAHNENPLQERIVSESVSPLQYIQTQQISTALRVLETVGYIMITKFRFRHLKKCYYALPILLEYKVLISIMENKCENSPGMLNEMYELLFRLTVFLYTESLGKELNHFHGTASKKRLQIDGKGDKKETVSVATFSILRKIVEPTLTVLTMVGSFTLYERLCFVKRVFDMMVEVINNLMLEIENESKATSASKRLCRTERQLIMDYMNRHPLSRRLREVSILTNTSVA